MKYFTCFLVAVAMVFFTSCNKEIVEMTYEKGEFSIVLDSSFKEKDASGVYAYYISKEYLVVCDKESFEDLPAEYADFSEDKYAEVVCAINEKSVDCIKKSGDVVYLEYTNKAEKKEYYYNSFIKKGKSAFYIITFTAEIEEDNSPYNSQFISWFNTVSVE